MMDINKKTLAVVGLGYVGLPLAVEAALKGYTVTGIDVSPKLLDQIDKRHSPFANDDRFAKDFARVTKKPSPLSVIFLA
ncbi:hypothetical protein IPL68_07320 [Candidatus Saccharibacteria bacterium]|nr:MAG: hypothetical protein IPL68_07320 [Candidatus Saccharibacteria bacterium]